MYQSEKMITDKDEIRSILAAGKYTTIALSDGNEPYIMTLSYGLDSQEDILYFHSAKKGMKLDFLKSNPYVCGTVIQDDGYQFGSCTHHYHSVIYKGIIEVIHNLDEKIKALNTMFEQLESEPQKMHDRFISKPENLDSVLIMKIPLEEIYGKSNPA